MAYTQTDIDTLEAKIKKFAGVKSTTFSDQSTVFDLEGAQALLAEMRRSVEATNGRSTTTRYAAFSKGLR